MQSQTLNTVNTFSGPFVIPSSNDVASRLATSATPERQAAPRVVAARQLPNPAPPRSRVNKSEWNAHRGQIQKLWLEEDRSLEETMRFMTENFQLQSVVSPIELPPRMESITSKMLTGFNQVPNCIKENSRNGNGPRIYQVERQAGC